ncbi:MAG: transaldolase family protein [Spirochaetia bacterium]|nr:transaldolase family protein [Spirochaetia bacterium]
MNKTYFHRVSELTPTRFWINNVTREEADTAIAAGAVGCTQNPSYVYKMLVHPVESPYALEKLDAIIANESDDEIVQEILQQQLVGEVAKHFLSLYEASKGKTGYVSVQGNPFREDTENIVRNARMNREAGENIMCKVPVTEDGLKAIEILIAEGIPINATEVMGVRQAMDVCDVYDRATRDMDNPPAVYYSHITGIYDEYLKNYAKEKQIEISDDILWQAGMVIAKKVHRLTKERGSAVGFIGGGARGLEHFTEMVGADCNITINWKGTADKLIEQNLPVVDRFHAPVSEGVLDELLEKVDDFTRGWMINGLEPAEYEEFGPVVLFRTSFEKSWAAARDMIAERRANQ